jgi:hypothetical protein
MEPQLSYRLRNISNGGLWPPGGMLQVVADLNCRETNSIMSLVNPRWWWSRFVTCSSVVDTAVDTGPVVVKGAGDADNRVVKHYPYSRGYSCAHPYSHLHCELLPGRVPARKIHPVSCLYPPPYTRAPNYGPEPILVFLHGYLLHWYPPQTVIGCYTIPLCRK